MGPEECGTFAVGLTTLDITGPNGLPIVGAEEIAHITGTVGFEVTDVLRPCGGEGGVVEAVSCDQIELMDGNLEDIKFLNAR